MAIVKEINTRNKHVSFEISIDGENNVSSVLLGRDPNLVAMLLIKLMNGDFKDVIIGALMNWAEKTNCMDLVEKISVAVEKSAAKNSRVPTPLDVRFE